MTLAPIESAERRELLDSLERPLSDYSTRELQHRARAFQQEPQARRAPRMVDQGERWPRRQAEDRTRAAAG